MMKNAEITSPAFPRARISPGSASKVEIPLAVRETGEAAWGGRGKTEGKNLLFLFD